MSISRARLMIWLLVALGLCGPLAATAGVLATIDTFGDFPITRDARVDYFPDSVDSGASSLSAAAFAGESGGSFYLREGSGDSEATQLGLDIEYSALEGGDGSTPELLARAVEGMHSGEPEWSLDFLVRHGRVSGERVSDYAGSGLYVGVAGLEHTIWANLFSRLSNPVTALSAAEENQMAMAAGTPAVPEPGILPLMLPGALALLAFRRRGGTIR